MTASDWPEDWQDTRDAVWESDLDDWADLDPEEALLIREALSGISDPADLDGPPPE